LAIIVKKLLNIFAALPNCQSTGGVSIEMAKPLGWQRRAMQGHRRCHLRLRKAFALKN
jgi:hypothetical protein